MSLSPLEQAIRNAMERAERANPDVRARIYQSARNALETGLRKQEVVDPEVLARQRERLEATIRTIENEELERLAAIARLEKVFIENLPDIEPETRGGTQPSPGREGPAGIAPVVRSDAGEQAPDPRAARQPDLRPEQRAEQRSGQRPDIRNDQRQEPRLEPRSAQKIEPPAEPTIIAFPGGRGSDPGAELSPDMRQDTGADIGRARRDEAERILTTAHRDEDAIVAGLAAGRDGDEVARHEEEDPAWAAPDTPAASRVTAGRKGRIRRAGSALIAVFVYSVILGSVAAGGWWVYSTGIWKSLAERSGNVPELIPANDGGDFDPAASPLDPQRGFSGDWIKVFRPADGRTTPHSGATVSRVSDSDGDAILVASSRPDSEGEVEIEIPASALQELAGKVVVFAVTARVEGDEPTQIYVECDFGALGECGRHRYPVGQDRADQLFKVDFTGKLGPAEPGRILINSDVSGKGAAIRIYGVRVLPAG